MEVKPCRNLPSFPRLSRRAPCGSCNRAPRLQGDWASSDAATELRLLEKSLLSPVPHCSPCRPPSRALGQDGDGASAPGSWIRGAHTRLSTACAQPPLPSLLPQLDRQGTEWGSPAYPAQCPPPRAPSPWRSDSHIVILGFAPPWDSGSVPWGTQAHAGFVRRIACFSTEGDIPRSFYMYLTKLGVLQNHPFILARN